MIMITKTVAIYSRLDSIGFDLASINKKLKHNLCKYKSINFKAACMNIRKNVRLIA